MHRGSKKKKEINKNSLLCQKANMDTFYGGVLLFMSWAHSLSLRRAQKHVLEYAGKRQALPADVSTCAAGD